MQTAKVNETCQSTLF